MRRLAWTVAARIGDKYQIRLSRSIYSFFPKKKKKILQKRLPAFWGFQEESTWATSWENLPFGLCNSVLLKQGRSATQAS